ncbi:HAMP domain-containing protein [Hanamia caeni]|uniref:histidine kinase n=2 Tax=Hanamia caeni TaxID=2294116 RepID=A0A3M9NR06_9BACT|nr:HAMP domain-containing protein [Hanamia caeni]
MFNLRDISIKNKLILMQVFTSLLVLSIVFGAFIFTDINSYKQRKMESMMSLAQVIGTNSISTLQFDDPDAATQMLQDLHNVSPEIIHATIFNNKGEIFAHYSKPGLDSFRIKDILEQRKFLFSGHELFVSSAITNNNEVIGKVYLDVELSELQQTKEYKLELAAILLIIALLFSFLVAVGVQTYISKRLLKLVSTMKKVSKTGDYPEPLADEGKDEIATLIQVFNKLMQQIKENVQKKDEFIGIASHELKTPLTTIKGYIEILNMMENEPTKKQFVEKAMMNVNKLELLIRDLLDVSKIQSGQLQLEMNEFNMKDLLKETVNAVQMVSTHRIILEDKLQNEIIYGDRQRIEQVLLNLLSNAIKYSPGENKVIIDSEKTDKELLIKIRDFGIGIAKEEQTNIFERFYRSKHSSVHISGFGLGLYICRDIITRHYGKIWVETTDRGSIFIFSLPLKHSLEIQQTEA